MYATTPGHPGWFRRCGVFTRPSAGDQGLARDQSQRLRSYIAQPSVPNRPSSPHRALSLRGLDGVLGDGMLRRHASAVRPRLVKPFVLTAVGAPTSLLRQPGEEVLHLLRFTAPHGALAPRGAPTRYDKLAVRYEATVLVAAINEWLGESPRCPAVITMDMGFWPCSTARCSLVVRPPRERPSPWSSGSTVTPPGGSF